MRGKKFCYQVLSFKPVNKQTAFKSRFRRKLPCSTFTFGFSCFNLRVLRQHTVDPTTRANKLLSIHFFGQQRLYKNAESPVVKYQITIVIPTAGTTFNFESSIKLFTCKDFVSRFTIRIVSGVLLLA